MRDRRNLILVYYGLRGKWELKSIPFKQQNQICRRSGSSNLCVECLKNGFVPRYVRWVCEMWVFSFRNLGLGIWSGELVFNVVKCKCKFWLYYTFFLKWSAPFCFIFNASTHFHGFSSCPLFNVKLKIRVHFKRSTNSAA